MSQRDVQTSEFWENYNQTVVDAPKSINTNLSYESSATFKHCAMDILSLAPYKS